MARPTISQRIALEGGDQIKRALADLGKAGEDAFSQLQKAGEKVNLTGPRRDRSRDQAASATVDELRQRLVGIGGVAAQSGSGFAQFGSVVETTQQRLVAAVNVGARVGLAVQGIGTAFSGAFGKVREFGEGVTGAVESVSSTVLKSTAALTAVPAAFLAIAVSASNAAAKIKEAAIAAGTSPQEYQKLTIAAEQMGGSEEKLVLALSAINEKVQEQSQNFFGNRQRLVDLREAMAKGGLAGRQAADDFQKLRREMELFGPSGQRGGQSIIDVEKALKSTGAGSRDAIERLKGFADEMSAIQDPAERSARVVEVFGRRLGPQLVELLSGGRKAIEDIGKRAEDLGLIMNNTEFKIAKDVNDALRASGPRHLRRQELGRPFVRPCHHRSRRALDRGHCQEPNHLDPLGRRHRGTRPPDPAGPRPGADRRHRRHSNRMDPAPASSSLILGVPSPTSRKTSLCRRFRRCSRDSADGGGRPSTASSAPSSPPPMSALFCSLAKMVGAFTLLAGVLKLVGGGLGLLRTAFTALAAAGTVLGAAMQALGGVFGVIRLAVTGLVAAFGAVPIAIAAIGVAIGFLAALIARAIDWSAFAERARCSLQCGAGVHRWIWRVGFVAIPGLFPSRAYALEQFVTAAQVAFAGIAQEPARCGARLQTLWSSGVARIGGIWNSIASAAASAMEQISAGAAALWTLIVPAWQAGIDAVGLLWERLKAGAQAAWQSLVAGVAATWDAIASAWSAGVDRVIGYLTKLRDFAVGVWNAIVDAAKRAFGAQQQAAGAAGGGGGGFARGRRGVRPRHGDLGLDPGLAFQRRVRRAGRGRSEVRTVASSFAQPHAA